MGEAEAREIAEAAVARLRRRLQIGLPVAGLLLLLVIVPNDLAKLVAFVGGGTLAVALLLMTVPFVGRVPKVLDAPHGPGTITVIGAGKSTSAIVRSADAGLPAVSGRYTATGVGGQDVKQAEAFLFGDLRAGSFVVAVGRGEKSPWAISVGPVQED